MNPPYRNRTIYRKLHRGGGDADYSGAPHVRAGMYKSTREQVELAVDLLYRRRWLIVLCFVGALSAAALYTYPVVQKYDAYSFIRVDLGRVAVPGRNSEIEVQVGPGSDNLFAERDRTISEELLLLEISSPLALRVAERLVEMQVFQGSGRPIPVLRGTSADRTVEQVANVVRRSVTFSPERGSYNVIRVAARSTDSDEAVLLANLFAKEYEKLTSEAGQERFSESRLFLEEQEQRRRDSLSTIEAQIQTYLASDATAGLNVDEQRLVVGIAGLEAQRDDLQLDLDVRRAQLASLDEEIRRLGSQVVSRATENPQAEIQALRERISALEQSKQQIEARYPEGERSEPVVKEIRRLVNSINELEAALARSSQSYVDQLMETGSASIDASASQLTGLKQKAELERSELKKLQARITLLDERIASQRAEYSKIPARSVHLADLQRQRTYAEQMYQFVAQRALESRLTSAGGAGEGYVRLLQPAAYSLPVQNNSRRNLVLGGFLGLLFGLGVAVVRDKLDNRIYKPDQITDSGDLVVGTVPDMRPFLKQQYGTKQTLELAGLEMSTSLVAALEPGSPAAGTYRPIRLQLDVSAADRPVRSVVITSPGVGDGKSVSAANLAATMAQAGRRILLVDADLHRPRQGGMFGIQRKPGLIQLLRGEAEFDLEATCTGIENLHVLTAGGSADDAAELLGSVRMTSLLKEWEVLFDTVVIDTPPVMAVTDALVVASQASAVIIVARAGKTREKELQYCTDSLRRVGARVLGTVLNGFDVSMAYGYKYRYQSYTSYGAYSDYAYAARPGTLETEPA